MMNMIPPGVSYNVTTCLSNGTSFSFMISPAALLSSNLISLVDLSAFLIMQFDGSKAGAGSTPLHYAACGGSVQCCQTIYVL
ncbi:uncharacterized protein LOC130138388 isoform X2 [Syzygium oleosum]|uniref:uncharacterized protein LOC130138388 isoform X2 n=1 Tax=Syzygium oleosum TaxID=219896 RepID=UPI0024BA8ACD|nr:uncharacterized protein LOC130138388 isoform X2 [Syzygium oleosum]